MVFFWRGWGIIVPVVFFIAIWLVGYNYDDETIGDSIESGRIAWSFFWGGIANLSLGIIFSLTMHEVDQSKAEPGEVLPDRRRHDFFWIPVWVWGILMTVLGIYLFSGKSDDGNSSGETEQVVENEDSNGKNATVIYQGERKVQFYNPTEDTVNVQVLNGDDEVVLNEDIPPTYMRWQVMDAGVYTVRHDLGTEEIEVIGTDTEDNERYDNAWYVVSGEVDLILLHVNEACKSDINKTELAAIDWIDKVHERYKGGSYLMPELKMSGFNSYTVYGPGLELPMEFQEDEQVYALIPIPEDQKMTEEFLDEMVTNLCF